MTKNEQPYALEIEGISRIELGCGSNKRDGFFGIDILPSPAVDHIMDFEKERLPFSDNSIDYAYSSHAFEHINSPQHILRELIRVCKNEATVEIWTPFGKSDDGMLFGHHIFYSEASFKHICFEYDRFYLGETHGFFWWDKTHYNLHPDILDELNKNNLSLDFALKHLFNVAMEWGVFLKVIKSSNQASGAQYPHKFYSVAGRQNEIEF
jgi:SAM-dependent methyltransferase